MLSRVWYPVSEVQEQKLLPGRMENIYHWELMAHLFAPLPTTLQPLPSPTQFSITTPHHLVLLSAVLHTLKLCVFCYRDVIMSTYLAAEVLEDDGPPPSYLDSMFHPDPDLPEPPPLDLPPGSDVLPPVPVESLPSNSFAETYEHWEKMDSFISHLTVNINFGSPTCAKCGQ